MSKTRQEVFIVTYRMAGKVKTTNVRAKTYRHAARTLEKRLSKKGMQIEVLS